MKVYLKVMECIMATVAILSICLGGMTCDSTGYAFSVAIKLIVAGCVALFGVLVCEFFKG